MKLKHLFTTALLLAVWTSTANASLVRYDVAMEGFLDSPDAYGYLLFEGPLNGGNIMPYLVDWEFFEPAAGFTFSAINGLADLDAQLLVDAQGSVVSHGLLCFGLGNGCQGAFAHGLVLLGESSSFTHPGGVPIALYGGATFSDPVTVALPASHFLLIVALLSLYLMTFGGSNIVGQRFGGLVKIPAL